MNTFAHITRLLVMAWALFVVCGTPTARANPSDAKAHFPRHRLGLVPLRLSSGVNLRPYGGPAAYLGLGVRVLQLGRWSMEGNAAVDAVGSRLQIDNTGLAWMSRQMVMTQLTVDGLVTVHPRLVVGGAVGFVHRSFRQSDFGAWNQIVANGMVPVVAARGDVYVLRTKRWGLAVASMLQTEVFPTQLHSNDGARLKYSPLTFRSGLRVALSLGQERPLDDALRSRLAAPK